MSVLEWADVSNLVESANVAEGRQLLGDLVAIAVGAEPRLATLVAGSQQAATATAILRQAFRRAWARRAMLGASSQQTQETVGAYSVSSMVTVRETGLLWASEIAALHAIFRGGGTGRAYMIDLGG